MIKAKTNKANLTSWKLLFWITDGLRSQSHRGQDALDKRVTLGKLRVLGCLFAHGGQSLMLKDIAERFRITPGAVSQTIDALAREGLVERITSQEDRRAVCIRLTDAGLKRRNELDAFFDSLMAGLLDGIPEDKQKVFFDVLQTIHQRLRQQSQSTTCV